MLSLHERVEILRELEIIGQGAAAILMKGFRKPLASLEFKGAIDLVTEYDRASEAFIRAEVGRCLPDFDLVAEEEGGTVSGTRPVIYADPLDGTTNFSHGHPFFAVSIALTSGDTLEAGVVIAPALGWTYAAARDHGATRNGEPCRVSAIGVLDRSLLATGFPYDRRTSPQNNLRAFVELKKRFAQGVRRCGAAAIDLCLVADGTYEGYWERKLRPWDLAGGAALVRAAGGRISDFVGGGGSVVSGHVVATNGLIHEALLAELASVAPASKRPTRA
jgi:myo-inositol-1(or 4)-monophosphatase